MRISVRDYLPEFFYGRTGFEGRVHHLYPDILGRITTGVGNLVDTPGAAIALPWKRPDGTRASAGEIEGEWYAVDAARTRPKGELQEGSIALHGGNSEAVQALTRIRLTDADVDNLFARTMEQFERAVKSYYPGFEGFPADAQLGILSMAWGLGAYFAPHWPKFTRAVNQGDFRSAARESHVSNFVPARNVANMQLFTNAADALEKHADPARLYYPGSVTPSVLPGGWAGGAVAVLLIAGVAAAAISQID